MQKIIIDIFNIVVKFSLLLTSQSWILESGEAKHPAYSQIQEAYRVFQEYSKFLYTGKRDRDINNPNTLFLTKLMRTNNHCCRLLHLIMHQPFRMDI